MRALVDALLESDDVVTTPDGEVGRWITVRGRAIFVREGGFGEDLDAERPAPIRDDEKKVIRFQDKKTKEWKERTEYADSWLNRASRFKFARVAYISRNRDQIQSKLESTIDDAYDDDGQLSHEGVVSAAALLILKTGMRVGSNTASYTTDKGVAKDYFKKTGKKKKFRTHGTTTLLRQHAKVSGDTVSLSYVGKAGVKRKVKVTDARLAKAVQSLLDKPGKSGDYLFRSGGGKGRRATADALRDRLKRIQPDLIAHDLRTAKAMEIACSHVGKVLSGRKQRIPSDPKKAKKLAKELEKKLGTQISNQLGNEPAVAIKNYTSPMLVEHMLRQYGFSPGILSESQAEKESFTAATRPIEVKKLELLNLIHGEDAVREWASAFVRDRESAEDAPSEHWAEL